MKAFIELIYVIVLAVASIFFGSYVLYLMWGWIIVPIFAVNALTIGQSFAIIVFKSYFFYKKEFVVKDEELTPLEKANKTFIETSSLYAFSLFFGWIATMFI